MSGRAISKLMLGVQGAAYGRGGAQVNRALFEQVLEDKMRELAAKSSGFSAAREMYTAKGIGRAEAVIEAEEVSGGTRSTEGSPVSGGVGSGSKPAQAMWRMASRGGALSADLQ